MSRNHKQHPEFFPSSTVAGVDYASEADGWKGDAHAELKAKDEVVADYCSPAIELGMPCDCLQAHGYSERLLAKPSCQACGGTGHPTVKTLVAGFDTLNDAIDQLAATAGDICGPAKVFLDLAWWHTENAIRKITGGCSMACKRGTFCGCCYHYFELKAKAQHAAGTFQC